MKPNISLLNILCRICGQEDRNCIFVFSEDGKKQALQKKIRTCLSLTIEETDLFPKQLCIACLNKLETAWNLSQLCKEGQIIIGKKLCASKLSTKNNQSTFLSSIEQKVKGLKENEKISWSGTSVISVVPATKPSPEDTTPVASLSEMLGTQPSPLLVNPAPNTFMQPTTAPVEQQAPTLPAPMPVESGVYPKTLIGMDAAGKPEVLQHLSLQRDERLTPIPAPRRKLPTPKLYPSPKQNTPSPVKRRALKEGNSSNIKASKRSNQMCRYCNKSFPDDIIDHHVNLHLRQSFITCVECNKNFRSEEAMSRHRCGAPASESINLDSDEEGPICL